MAIPVDRNLEASALERNLKAQAVPGLRKQVLLPVPVLTAHCQSREQRRRTAHGGRVESGVSVAHAVGQSIRDAF